MTSDLRLLLDEKLGHVGRCIYLECILWEWRSSRLPSNDAIARFSLSEVEDVRRFFQIAGDAYYKGDDGFRRNRVTQELRDEKLGKSAARRQARKGKFVDVLSEQNSNTDIVSRSRSRFQSGSSANGEEALKNGNWGELFTWWKSHGGGYSRVQLAAQYFSDRWNEPGKFAAMKATWPLWEASWESGVQIGELDNWLKNFDLENKPLVFTKKKPACEICDGRGYVVVTHRHQEQRHTCSCRGGELPGAIAV